MPSPSWLFENAEPQDWYTYGCVYVGSYTAPLDYDTRTPVFGKVWHGMVW